MSINQKEIFLLKIGQNLNNNINLLIFDLFIYLKIQSLSIILHHHFDGSSFTNRSCDIYLYKTETQKERNLITQFSIYLFT